VVRIFTFIGVGVVVGLVVGVVMELFGDPPAWGVGALAGTVSAVVAWLSAARLEAELEGRRDPLG
jgi:hypothetical protein